MCGIAGVVRYGSSGAECAAALAPMIARLRHRGPDGEGTVFGDAVALGHTRLALVDVPNGTQPMRSPDGRYTITYNGEVYDQAALRAQMPEWTFRTRSDCETVLAAYATWGKQCAERLNGMFAFFVWDNALQRGFGARDALGVKPFAYTRDRQGFAFASEAKALVSHARPCIPAIVEYLVAACMSGVERSMFEGIEYLPAGHTVTVDETDVRLERYFDPRLRACDDFDTRRMREAIERAIKRTLALDVPIATLLSGGLDSTIIAAVARKETRSPAFTVRFEDHDTIDYARGTLVTSNDTPFATLAARELEIDHHWVDVASKDVLADIGAIAAHNDALPAWEQEIAQHRLFAAISKTHKAALVGDCADETHFGYHFLLDEQASRSPRNILERLGVVPVRRDVDPDPIGALDAKYRRIAEEAGESWVTPRSRVLATTALILRRWLPRLLHNGDIHAMAHSVEARVPFADKDLVDLALGIRSVDALRGGVEKGCLREAVRGLLPEVIRVRKKSALPKDQRTFGEYARAFVEILDDPPDLVRRLVDLDALRAARPDTEPNRAILFRVIALARFAEEWKLAV